MVIGLQKALLATLVVAGEAIDSPRARTESSYLSSSLIQRQPVSNEKAPSFRMLFVTDCKSYTAVQGLSLLASARAVGHTEPIDWLRMCGEKQVSLPVDVRSIYPAAEVLTVTAHGEAKQLLGDYVYSIKASALPEWISWRENLHNDTNVLFLDGDQLFVNRFDSRLSSGGSKEGLAAHYGIAPEWARFLEPGSLERSHVCGVGASKFCASLSPDEYEKEYDIGLPALLTKGDWEKMALSWRSVLSRGYHMENETLRKQLRSFEAEMQAFGLAAASEDIRFKTSTDLMVGDVLSGGPSGNGEGWHLVDTHIEAGGDPCKSGTAPSGRDLPSFLHLGGAPWGQKGWYFSKYQIPPGWNREAKDAGFLECAAPLLAPLPHNLLETAEKYENIRGKVTRESLDLTEQQERAISRREAWALCSAVNIMNLAISSVHDVQGCNNDRTLRLRMHPTVDWRNDVVKCSGGECEALSDETFSKARFWEGVELTF